MDGEQISGKSKFRSAFTNLRDKTSRPLEFKEDKGTNPGQEFATTNWDDSESSSEDTSDGSSYEGDSDGEYDMSSDDDL